MAKDTSPAAAARQPTLALKPRELEYLAEVNKGRTVSPVGEVRTQRLLDPETGEVIELKVRTVKTKRRRRPA